MNRRGGAEVNRVDAASKRGRVRQLLKIRHPLLSGEVSTASALDLVGLMGTMGGIVGLHARQVPSHGRLGTTGFLAAFMGTAVLLLGIVFSFVVGSAST